MAFLSACQDTIDEITEIPKICFDLGRLVNPRTKEQLHEFASQVDILNPQFNAAGFFVVNFSAFPNVFTAIISYIIVLIQFNGLT